MEELFDLLKENYELGVKLPKPIWPARYVAKWRIRNLYKCDLGRDWRMTYTLLSEVGGIAVVALEVLTHKEYSRLFGYETS